ncbi:MAG: hypothetical protein DPW18_17870 [Chloroflexi bacterium]|nr:hypothetical protein [Chloroflexi bacterium CFX2]MCQ3938890.1 hypothetical protein [Chloroflexota bacterium]MDL1943580.1 hypothetical protein [Chloroflexi bacterium CFX2]
MSSAYHERLKQIKISYPNAYGKWTEFDDELLKQEFANGTSVKALSKLFHRQPSAIRSRIRKLGFETKDETPNEVISKDDGHSLGTDFQFRWTAVFYDPGKEYLFPQPVTTYMLENYKYPVIYRWIVYQDNREKIQYAYIGTTKQLCPSRLEGYLYPDSSSTNLRLHQEFQEFIKHGYKIGLESLQVEQIKMNNVDVKLNNLHSETARIFIETLLISYYRQNGLTLLNQ